MKTGVLDERLAQRLADAERRFAQVNEQLSDPAVLRDRNRLRELSQERSGLESVVETAAQLRRAADDLEQARDVMRDGDPELRELAQEEAAALEAKLEELVVRAKEEEKPAELSKTEQLLTEIRDQLKSR